MNKVVKSGSPKKVNKKLSQNATPKKSVNLSSGVKPFANSVATKHKEKLDLMGKAKEILGGVGKFAENVKDKLVEFSKTSVGKIVKKIAIFGLATIVVKKVYDGVSSLFSGFFGAKNEAEGKIAKSKSSTFGFIAKLLGISLAGFGIYKLGQKVGLIGDGSNNNPMDNSIKDDEINTENNILKKRVEKYTKMRDFSKMKIVKCDGNDTVVIAREEDDINHTMLISRAPDGKHWRLCGNGRCFNNDFTLVQALFLGNLLNLESGVITNNNEVPENYDQTPYYISGGNLKFKVFVGSGSWKSGILSGWSKRLGFDRTVIERRASKIYISDHFNGGLNEIMGYYNSAFESKII